MSTAIPPQNTSLLDGLAVYSQRLWDGRVSEASHGVYVGEADVPTEKGFGFLEFLLLLLRPLGLVLVWPIWRLERALAAWKGIFFSCPTCHHRTRDPYVYCPACGHVQGRIRPTIGTVFTWRCSCSKTTWPVLGNYLLRSLKHRVCRNTTKSFGCYRPIPFKEVGKPRVHQHVVIASPGLRAKHAFLSHFVHHALAMQPPGAVGQGQVWDLNQAEIELLRRDACHSYSQDTSACEHRSDGYTLARTLILPRAGQQRLVVHNLARPWTKAEGDLYTRGPNWKSVRSLILVIDLDEVERNGRKVALSHIELLERVIRAIQKGFPLEPNAPLPLRIAVAVPLGPTAGARPLITKARQLSAQDAEEIVRQTVPALYSVLRLSTPQHNLRFWGGDMPDGLHLERTHWIRSLLDWSA